jgi:hypothetical protein
MSGFELVHPTTPDRFEFNYFIQMPTLRPETRYPTSPLNLQFLTNGEVTPRDFAESSRHTTRAAHEHCQAQVWPRQSAPPKRIAITDYGSLSDSGDEKRRVKLRSLIAPPGA